MWPPPPQPPAAAGGSAAAERLDRWLSGFAERHGAVETTRTPDAVTLRAEDGAVAVAEVPFPPLTGDLVAHAAQDRRVGVLLVRLGGYAAGVFEGTTLVSSKVGSRQVHGRSAAGGQSQQRFARRRDGQSRVALAAAADNAVRILVPKRRAWTRWWWEGTGPPSTRCSPTAGWARCSPGAGAPDGRP